MAEQVEEMRKRFEEAAEKAGALLVYGLIGGLVLIVVGGVVYAWWVSRD